MTRPTALERDCCHHRRSQTQRPQSSGSLWRCLLGALIATALQGTQQGKKDGTAIVLGDMVPGQRLKTSVKALHGVGLDIDTGTPTVTREAALKIAGLPRRPGLDAFERHNKTVTERSRKTR